MKVTTMPKRSMNEFQRLIIPTIKTEVVNKWKNYCSERGLSWQDTLAVLIEDALNNRDYLDDALKRHVLQEQIDMLLDMGASEETVAKLREEIKKSAPLAKVYLVPKERKDDD